MAASAVEEVRKLMAKKDEIEEEIKQYMLVLQSQGDVGMHGSLVDEEQFPRTDVDVYTVRHARHRVICLQNDHKMVMKHIEEKLHEVHAHAREERVVHQIGELSTDGNHTVHNNGSSIPRIPFAKITLVDGGSPAESARLQAGDEIVQFGSIDSNNFESMQTIATIVQHSKAKAMVVTVVRDGKETRVSLTPNTWSGRGLLGCNIVPLKK